MSARLHRGPDVAALAADAAAAVARALRRLASDRGLVSLGLCGGRSVSALYQRLAAEDVPWARVHIFLADERMVPLDHPDSNSRLVRETLVDRLGALLPPGNFHPFAPRADAADGGVAGYGQRMLHLTGGLSVLVLSAGEDGHIAALYPCHHSVRSRARGTLAMTDSPKPPPARMTAGPALIAGADAAALMILGEAKREALARFLDPALTPEDCPAKLVETIPEAHVFTDLEAP